MPAKRKTAAKRKPKAKARTAKKKTTKKAKASVGKAWTAAEVKRLRDLYKAKPASAIAKTLRRSLASVRGKISALGLKKPASARRKKTTKKAATKRKTTRKAAAKKRPARKKTTRKKTTRRKR